MDFHGVVPQRGDFTVVVSYKAGNLVAYKAGHLAAYKATHPSIWVRQLLPIRPHTPKLYDKFWVVLKES